jgi:hypothetical protein
MSLFADATDPESAFAAIQIWAGQVEGLGGWVDVPYRAAAFTCSVGGTWTVPEGQFRFIGTPSCRI